MTYQLNIFLLLFGALQGSLLSLFLVRRNSLKDSSQTLFVLFILVVTLQLVFKVITKTWLWTNVRLIYNLSYCLPYLIGPLVFLFVRSKLYSNPFRAIDSLHFTPFIISVTQVCILTILSSLDPLPIWTQTISAQFIFQILVLAGYVGISMQLVIRSQIHKNLKSGLKRFLIGVLTAEAIIILTLALMKIYVGQFPDVRLLFIVLTLLIYWVSYRLMSQPELFTTIESISIVKSKPTLKYANSGLKPDEAHRIAGLLLETMEQQKLFLASDISIDSLAKQLCISKYHLSQVFNEHFQKSLF